MAQNNTNESVSIYSADISQLTESFNELMQQITQTREEMKGLKAGTSEYNALAKKLTDQEKQLAKAFKDGTVQIDKEKTSYRQLNDVLRDLRKTYREVGTEQERNDLTEGIQAFDKELKSMDASIGNFHRHVGNYEGALLSVGRTLLDDAGAIDIIDNKTARLFVKLSRDIPKLISNLGSVETATRGAGNVAEGAAGKATAGLSSVIFKLGVLTIAIGAAAAIYKIFQSEIDRGLKKLKDWGKSMLGIEEYTINNTKAQKEFAEALKQTTAQLAGQITTYKILEALVTSYALSQANSEKAASELLKVLKETDDATNRAKLANSGYTNSIETLIEALYAEAKANAIVQFMTNQVGQIISMQNEIVENNIKKNQRIRDKEAGVIKGFWNALKVGLIANGRDISQAVDMVNDSVIANIDKDNEYLEKKIEEAKKKLPQEFKELLEAVFPEGEGGDAIMKALFGDIGSPSDNGWYSKFELIIKEIEATQEDYWKYSKRGYGLYLQMYDEIAEHYKTDEKKHREALANKKAFIKQYNDYVKKLGEEDQDYGEGQYQKDLNALERWKNEQVKLYKTMGMDTTRLLEEYDNRKLAIENKYLDKYKDLNDKYNKTVKEQIKVREEALKKLVEGFNKIGTSNALTSSGEGFTELKKAAQEVADANILMISAETEVRKKEIEKQRDDELISLKEKLGNTEKYKEQEAELIEYYNNLILEAEKRRDAEIEAEQRNSLSRRLDYLSDYYSSQKQKVEIYTNSANTVNERAFWNNGWGTMSTQSVNVSQIDAEIDKVTNTYLYLESEIKEKQQAINDILISSTTLTIDQRLEYEQEYVNLSNELENARLEHATEVGALMLERDKEVQKNRVQAFQESFNQIGNLFDALYGMYEADVQAQLERGEITQEAAEKELEEYRGIKATAAAMDALASAVGAYNSMASIPYVGPALGAIAAAAALAAGYANVKKILTVSKNNQDAGQTYQTVTPTLVDYTPAGVTNVTGEQETEQLANALSKTPIIVRVSDIDDAQNRVITRVSEATF